jgi:hypothetical protein
VTPLLIGADGSRAHVDLVRSDRGARRISNTADWLDPTILARYGPGTPWRTHGSVAHGYGHGYGSMVSELTPTQTRPDAAARRALVSSQSFSHLGEDLADKFHLKIHGWQACHPCSMAQVGTEPLHGERAATLVYRWVATLVYRCCTSGQCCALSPPPLHRSPHVAIVPSLRGRRSHTRTSPPRRSFLSTD